MIAEIITIGDELMRGEIVDSNKARIAERLLLHDLDTRHQVSVLDDPTDMRDAFERAAVRSDLCSRGARAGWALRGGPPFHASAAFEVLCRVVSEPAPPLLSVRPDAPPALAEIVDRLLRKKPEERFADAAELQAALAACACIDDWTDERAEEWWRTVESMA